MNRPALILVACTLASCSSERVIDLGQGRYSVTGSSAWRGNSAARVNAVEDAQEACQDKRKKAVIDSFEDSHSAFESYGSSVVFHCE
jgi:hypothetical protein